MADRESKLLYLIDHYGTLNQKLIAIEEMAEDLWNYGGVRLERNTDE